MFWAIGRFGGASSFFQSRIQREWRVVRFCQRNGANHARNSNCKQIEMETFTFVLVVLFGDGGNVLCRGRTVELFFAIEADFRFSITVVARDFATLVSMIVRIRSVAKMKLVQFGFFRLGKISTALGCVGMPPRGVRDDRQCCDGTRVGSRMQVQSQQLRGLKPCPTVMNLPQSQSQRRHHRVHCRRPSRLVLRE